MNKGILDIFAAQGVNTFFQESLHGAASKDSVWGGNRPRPEARRQD
jgi:hypothetical protein